MSCIFYIKYTTYLYSHIVICIYHIFVYFKDTRNISLLKAFIGIFNSYLCLKQYAKILFLSLNLRWQGIIVTCVHSIHVLRAYL